MVEIYDVKKDEQFSKGYIDVDELRIRSIGDGVEIPYRYMHGGFEGTDVKFSFCFPEKDNYEERFYQYLAAASNPDGELASLPVTGEDDKIGFCLTHGAYYVESNMGVCAAFVNTEDNTMTYRSSAATAEFSRVMAQKTYGYEHRPYGYVYGGSGGGYRTIACIENTNAFDGAIPFIIGSPYAIPNCQSTRTHAVRLLRHKMARVIDAVDVGGSGNPYEGLNEEETAVLKEATQFGYPLKSWFCSANLEDGALPVLLPGVKEMDPAYFEDFWKVPGYLGADPKGSAVRDRICMSTKIKGIYIPEPEHKKEEESDAENVVYDVWKKIMDNKDIHPWIELEEAPEGNDLYLKGAEITFIKGKATGHKLAIRNIDGNRVYPGEGFGMGNMLEVLGMLEVSDEVHLDNSDYIAVQTYHRHQVPDPSFGAWDQFRNEDQEPLYPQRKRLLGPIFCGQGTGCRQSGEIQCKTIIVAALMDEMAYPWQADWYRRKIAFVHGGNADDICRLWYFEHTLHDENVNSVNELHVTSYAAGLKQALIDVAKWVEKGKEPLPSTNYQVNIGEVVAANNAAERSGIQPIVNLTANGSDCANVKPGQEVTFIAKAEVPTGAGSLTSVEWSFEGEQDFPLKSEFELVQGGQQQTIKAVHSFTEPGTYFVVVRVKSERNGDKKALYTQIRNIARVRVVVK